LLNVTQSGNIALLKYANKEAISFFREAIELSTQINTETTIENIGMERKVGQGNFTLLRSHVQAYCNLGQFKKADTHLRKALLLMGIEIPTDSSKLKSVKRRTLTFNMDKKAINVTEIAHRKREVVIVLLALSKVNYYACCKPIAHYCSELALTLAEDTSLALLGEANAIASICSSDTNAADILIAKAKEHAGKQIDVIKSVAQTAGMIYSSRANWEKAQESFTTAINAAQTVGDLRAFEESTIFLGTLQFLKGEVEKSVATTALALQSAVLRGDVQTQILALTEQARNYYTLGENIECLKALDEAQLALENDDIDGNDVAAEINFYGLKALMVLKTNDLMECWHVAEEVFHVIEKAEPTAYYTFFGYAALVEVYVLLNQNASFYSRVPKQKVQARAEKILIALAKFSKVYPIALPRLNLWQGVMNYLNSKLSKAEKDWTKALEYAEHYQMKYEQALIYYHRGIYLKSKIDIEAAFKVFPQIKSKGLEMRKQKETKLSKILGEKIPGLTHGYSAPTITINEGTFDPPVSTRGSLRLSINRSSDEWKNSQSDSDL
jgi:tetratricopeptide (TPR) repeat protein